jgi:hypothetical protein
LPVPGLSGFKFSVDISNGKENPDRENREEIRNRHCRFEEAASEKPKGAARMRKHVGAAYKKPYGEQYYGNKADYVLADCGPEQQELQQVNHGRSSDHQQFL